MLPKGNDFNVGQITGTGGSLIFPKECRDKHLYVYGATGTGQLRHHKHPKVQKWLAKHPRFHLHFTPTSASWLNMVERFFRDLTVNRLRRGVFHSVSELVTALEKYIAQHNKEPKPFIWTAKASDILAKVVRARKKLSRKASSH